MASWLEQAVLWSCSGLGAVVIYKILARVLRTSRGDIASLRPDTLFTLEELLSPRRSRLLVIIYAMPVAVLFFIVCLYSPAFVGAAKQYLVQSLITGLEPSLQASTKGFLEAAPDFLSPIFVLGLGLILFSPVLKSPINLAANIFVDVSGIRDRADFLCKRLARKLMSSNGSSVSAVDAKLAGQNWSTNVDPRLIGSAPETQIKYKLLYVLKTDFSDFKLDAAFDEIAVRLNIEPLGTANNLGDRPLFAALGFYFICCLLYVTFVPYIGHLAISEAATYKIPVIWPEVGARGALALSVVQRTLSFVIPLLIGFYLLSSRRRIFDDYDPKTPEVTAKESIYRTLAVVGSYVFTSSFVVNIVFTVLVVARRYAGELTGALLSLNNEQVWMEIIVYTLAPVVVLSIATLALYLSFNLFWTYFTGCIVSGLSFMTAQLICESSIIGPGGGYYWHQLLLGISLCGMYFLVARILQDRMLDLREVFEFQGASKRRSPVLAT